MNEKYLKRQGEPESLELTELLQAKGSWRHLVAIPCCGEDDLMPQNLHSLAGCDTLGLLLVLLLINEGPNTKLSYRESNQRTLLHLRSSYTLKSLNNEQK